MPAPHSHLRLSREQLYELVWVKPMQHLAKEYGISDRALAKLCGRQQVPVPPRGYWARVSAGQKREKPPLPASIAKQTTKDKTVSNEVKMVPEKTEKRRAVEPSYWDERDKKIKSAVRELRKRFSETTRYKIEVKDWSCNYSFGINHQFDPLYKKDHFAFMHREPYSEWRHFVFECVFISPPQFKDKSVSLNLYGRDYLNAAEREKNSRHYEETPPTSVGELQKANEGFWAHVSCPANAIHDILQIASANKINFISLCAEKMRYGQASILTFSLDDNSGEDDEAVE